MLLAATAADGFMITVKKTDSSANEVTVDGSASETIDGSLTDTIANQYDSITYRCDGTNWFVVADATLFQNPDASETVKGIIELATQAEVDARSDAVKAVTPATLASNLTTNIGFNSFYESTEQVFAFSSNITLTHGLGSIPKLVSVEFVCKTTDVGYAAEDRIPLSGAPISFSNGITPFFNTTQVGCAIGGTFVLIHKTTFAQTAMTPAKWKIVLRAWA
jgi:hypothetical protein